MRLLLFLGLVAIGAAVLNEDEQMVFAASSLSLQELLDKVRIITEQLSQESLMETPLFKIEEIHTDEEKTEENKQPV